MNRIVIVIDGGVPYTYADPNVEVCILDLDNEPEVNPEDYEGFVDLVPECLK